MTLMNISHRGLLDLVLKPRTSSHSNGGGYSHPNAPALHHSPVISCLFLVNSISPYKSAAFEADSIPIGSAVAVERVFCGGRDTVSLRRASLKPETIRRLMLVKHRLLLERRIRARLLQQQREALSAESSVFRWCDGSGLIAPAVVAAGIVVASHAEYEPGEAWKDGPTLVRTPASASPGCFPSLLPVPLLPPDS